MNVRRAAAALLCVVMTAPATLAQASGAAVPTLWNEGKVAFGAFVPNENPAPRGQGGPPAADGRRPKPVYTRAGGEKLAANPLLDFVFLNLEGSYDATAVKAIADGLQAGAGGGVRKTLIVRIPSIEAAGHAATRARVKEAFELGADGVTIPHVRSLEEAKQAIAMFADAGVDVWTPANPRGTKIAMLMLEDPGAVAQASQIADLPGYSVLACGIGSLAQALGGDRAAAEAGTQQVLAATRRARKPNMLTASPQDVETRVKEGFLGLLVQGAAGDETIRIGRAAAGRR